MMLKEATERAINMYETGEVKTMAEANVQIVRMMGVRLIRGPLPKEVRAGLNAAVREKRLGHIKKEGLRPEVYFHPNSIWNAKEARNRVFAESTEKLKKVFATPNA